MQLGACVTVRFASTRLKGKALTDISGHPALWWLCRQLKYSSLQFVLCTSTDSSNDCIEAFALEHSIPCYRGLEHDVLGRMVEAANKFGFDSFYRITGDDLFVDPKYLNRSIDDYDGSDYAYTNLPKGTEFQIIRTDYAKHIHEEWSGNDTEYLTWILNTAPKQQFLRYMATDENYAFELDNESDLLSIRTMVDDLQLPVFEISDLLRYASETGIFPKKETIDRRVICPCLM